MINLDVSAPISQNNRSLAPKETASMSQHNRNSRHGKLTTDLNSKLKNGSNSVHQRNINEHSTFTRVPQQSTSVANTLPPRTSSKLKSTYDNSTTLHVQQQQTNSTLASIPIQRNSKLNELFGDVTSHYYKAKNHSTIEQKQPASSISGLKYMETLLGEKQSKFQ